ncbi:cytochrome-c peroxidase [Luteolibacter marinus]|uniref:cytochrome-c peroxidase n=1 Tax=Luteolibacter marinus TaxID=2776705 RepID=UPI001865D275|nr:cytochrome c peroxidase [Luteolibacter marinus]
MKRLTPWLVCLGTSAAALAGANGPADNGDAAQRQAALAAVGREIFLDTALSNPPGQGCVSCHVPESAFADPRPVSPGAVAGRQGRRNAPSLMYAALIPNMDQEDLLGPDGVQHWAWQGGLFQDGRARTLHEQVQQPIFDHAEMNTGDVPGLAGKLRNAGYAAALRECVGDSGWEDDGQVAHACYRALVEFLKEPMFRPFDAPIDRYLAGGSDALDAIQKRGLEVYLGKGKCADCHLLTASAWPKPLLSDYGYDNLGTPSRGAEDPGLGGHTGAAGELGQFRAPSLRNVVLTAPYFHNGSIASLREVVEFYNRRDLEPGRWGATDYPETVNHEDLGNLGLSDGEVDDLVALMGAFTDRSLIRMIESSGSFPLAPAGTPDSWSMRAYFPDWNHSAPLLPPHPPHRDAVGEE